MKLILGHQQSEDNVHRQGNRTLASQCTSSYIQLNRRIVTTVAP
jgi:hypothetical protein